MASVADEPGPLNVATPEDGRGYEKPGRVGRGVETVLPVVIGWVMADDGMEVTETVTTEDGCGYGAPDVGMASVADEPGPLEAVMLEAVTLEDGRGYEKPGRVGRGTEAVLPVVIGSDMADDGVGGTIATVLSTVVPGMTLMETHTDSDGAGTTAEEPGMMLMETYTDPDGAGTTAEEPGAVGRAELVSGGMEMLPVMRDQPPLAESAPEERASEAAGWAPDVMSVAEQMVVVAVTSVVVVRTSVALGGQSAALTHNDVSMCVEVTTTTEVAVSYRSRRSAVGGSES